MGAIAKLKSHKIFEENIEKFKAQYNMDLDGISVDNLQINYNDGDSGVDKDFEEFVRIETTQEELPLDRLGRDNPILHYTEINLFDDELNDNGLAQGNFR